MKMTAEKYNVLLEAFQRHEGTINKGKARAIELNHSFMRFAFDAFWFVIDKGDIDFNYIYKGLNDDTLFTGIKKALNGISIKPW